VTLCFATLIIFACVSATACQPAECVRPVDYANDGDDLTGEIPASATVVSSEAGRLRFLIDDDWGTERTMRFPAAHGQALAAPGAGLQVDRYAFGFSAELGFTVGDPSAPLAAFIRDETGPLIAIIDGTEAPLNVRQHRVIGECFDKGVVAADTEIEIETDTGREFFVSGEDGTLALDGLTYFVRVLVAFDNEGILVSRAFLLRLP